MPVKLTANNEYAELVAIATGEVMPVAPVPVSGTPTGQITVVTAGTAVAGPSVAAQGGFYLQGHPDNTDTIWFFGPSDTKASGYPLQPGTQIAVAVGNLNQLKFDADTSGEKVCWAKA